MRAVCWTTRCLRLGRVVTGTSRLPAPFEPNVSCTVQRTQKQYILVDFSQIDCQGSTTIISQQSGFMKGGSLHCHNCRYFSSCTTYRSNNARIFCFECPSKACGCKEEVVTFLPVFKYGDMRHITILSGSDSLAERSLSFPKYRKALHRYLVSLSTNIQIFAFRRIIVAVKTFTKQYIV